MWLTTVPASFGARPPVGGAILNGGMAAMMTDGQGLHGAIALSSETFRPLSPRVPGRSPELGRSSPRDPLVSAMAARRSWLHLSCWGDRLLRLVAPRLGRSLPRTDRRAGAADGGGRDGARGHSMWKPPVRMRPGRRYEAANRYPRGRG